MTQRTRYFLVGSALVVVVGLWHGPGGVLQRRPFVRRRVSRTASSPTCRPTSTALAYADVRTIMNSAFRQKLREVLPTGEGKDELQRDLGLDIERDIDIVVAGFTGDEPVQGRRPGPGARPVQRRPHRNDGGPARRHGRGLPRQADAADARETTMRLAEGQPVPEGVGGPRWASSSLACWPSATRRSCGRRLTGPARKRHHEERRTDEARQRRAQRRQRVGRRPVRRRSRSMRACPTQIKAQLPAVQYVAVSAHVNGGVNGTLRAETRDEQAAQDLQGRAERRARGWAARGRPGSAGQRRAELAAGRRARTRASRCRSPSRRKCSTC